MAYPDKEISKGPEAVLDCSRASLRVKVSVAMERFFLIEVAEPQHPSAYRVLAVA